MVPTVLWEYDVATTPRDHEVTCSMIASTRRTTEPFASPDEKLVQIRVTIAEFPNTLVKIVNILNGLKVDPWAVEHRTLERGKVELFFLVDMSKCTCSLSDIKGKILGESAVKSLKYASSGVPVESNFVKNSPDYFS